MYIKDLLQMHLSLSESEKFAEWAIGKDYKKFQGHDWPTLWNELHGDIFTIDPSSKILDDMPKMIELWRTNEM
jgi:hypothetical protein